MSEFYVIPTIGTFKVNITPYNNRITNKTLYNTLSVGGNMDKCVNLTIYPEESPDSKKILLSWTEVIDKACTVDSEVIKGSKSVEMLHLAFTIASELAPYAEYVLFNDMSYFHCNTPDGKIKVSLPPYHIAFHNKTWYEDKFNAVMNDDNEYKKYKKYMENMYEKRFMPEAFNFGNDEILEMLYPLYIKSNNWKEFFDIIEKNFSKNKCVIMYPWINSAMNLIFEGNPIYAGAEWKINLSTITKIHYYELDKSHVMHGGFNKKYRIQHYNYRDVNYNNTMKWNIRAFLKMANKTHSKSKQRKNVTSKKK